MTATPDSPDTGPRDDGVMHGRAVWNGPPGSEPVEGEGGPDADGVIVKVKHDARVKPAGPKSRRKPTASAEGAVVHCGGTVELPAQYESSRHATVTFETLWAATMAIGEGPREELATEVAGLRSEVMQLKVANAELKANLAEARAKSDQTAFVVERLRVENRGPPGPQGLMGRDGRDGKQGPPGPKGSRGQRGFEIVEWKVDVAAYHATPQFYDGSEGPRLNLLPLFERYNADTEADDVEAAIEQVAYGRAELELRAERVKRGLPER
jgi:hypothetical protein